MNKIFLLLSISLAASLWAMDESDAKKQKIESNSKQVPALIELCNRRIFGILCDDSMAMAEEFLNETCKALPTNLFFMIIDGLIERNAIVKVYDHRDLRLSLAKICIKKGMTEFLPKDPSTGLPTEYENSAKSYFNKAMSAKPGNQCPYGKKALEIIQHIIQDPFFRDKAELQPLTHLVLTTREQGDLCIDLMQEMFMHCLNDDGLFHTLCQLIMKDATAAFIFLRRLEAPPYELLKGQGRAAQLWRWADVFKSVPIKDYVEKTYINLDSEKQASIRTSLFLQFALYKGDIKVLESYPLNPDNVLLCIADSRFFEIESAERPLVVASQLGYTKTVEYLFQKVASGDVRKACDRALAYGHTDVLKVLCPDDKMIDVAQPLDLKKETAFDRACLKGYIETIEFFLSRCTPQLLSHLICGTIYKEGPYRLLLIYLERSSIDEKQKQLILHFLLCFAIEIGNCDAAKTLLKRVTSLVCPDFFDDHFFGINLMANGTLLERAVTFYPLYDKSERYLALIELLISKGARDVPQKDGTTLLSQTNLRLGPKKLLHAYCQDNKFDRFVDKDIVLYENLIKVLEKAQIRRTEKS